MVIIHKYKFDLFLEQQLNTNMSEFDIATRRDSLNLGKQNFGQENNIAEQVINNSVFRMLLKDMIEEIFQKKVTNPDDKSFDQPLVGAQCFIEEIGDSLIIVAQHQATKKIKEAEKFLNQLYDHKVKEIEERFEQMIQEKLKEVDEKIKEIEELIRSENRIESSYLSPNRKVLKSKTQIQSSFNQQINKRMQLKQKLLNSSTLVQPVRLTLQVNSSSMLPDDLLQPSNCSACPSACPSAQISQNNNKQLKSLEQSLRQQIKAISQKIGQVESKCKSDIQDLQSSMREQLDAGFEGIWNVITNLEKRMIHN